MKCEKCGKEACYFSYSNINGKIIHQCLCNECANNCEDAEINSPNITRHEYLSDILRSFFGNISHIPGQNLNIGCKKEAKNVVNHNYIDEDLSRERNYNELRYALKDAIRKENYELAAEIRDRLNGGN